MSSLTALTPGTWNIDASHSRVGFVARHLMITKVRGSFERFTGTVTVGADLASSSVEATVELDSINTGDEKRDGHLKSPDFFNVEVNPTMTFRSTAITVNGTSGVLSGDLTLNGITKGVAFDVDFEGVGQDPWGGTRASFSGSTEINRKDWGVEWNVALEAGGVLVSEKVKIELDIQVVKA